MKIDLGQKNDIGAPCAPSESKEKVHYPSLYFTHDKPVELPEEGTAVITFRKIESSENTRDPDDPKYRCELEVHSIEIQGGKKKEERMVSVGDAFKKAVRSKMKEKAGYEEEED